jgi:hypothetical protein
MNENIGKTYRVVDYHSNQEFTGWMGKRYTDLDIARFWAIQKSEEYNSAVALYYGERMLNLYIKGQPAKESDLTPDFILTLTRREK